jgi:hypothetical protein
MEDFGFYPEHDCPRCGGTGWVTKEWMVQSCICVLCRSSYISRLEEIIYNCVDDDMAIEHGVHMGVYIYVVAQFECQDE